MVSNLSLTQLGQRLLCCSVQSADFASSWKYKLCKPKYSNVVCYYTRYGTHKLALKCISEESFDGNQRPPRIECAPYEEAEREKYLFKVTRVSFDPADGGDDDTKDYDEGVILTWQGKWDVVWTDGGKLQMRRKRRLSKKGIFANFENVFFVGPRLFTEEDGALLDEKEEVVLGLGSFYQRKLLKYQKSAKQLTFAGYHIHDWAFRLTCEEVKGMEEAFRWHFSQQR